MTAVILALKQIRNKISTIEDFLNWIKLQIRKPSKPVAAWLHSQEITANHVTATRFPTAVIIWLLLSNGHKGYALLAWFIAAWTDNLDGIMAETEREQNRERSKIWGLFDSLVDKFCIITTAWVIVKTLSLVQFEGLVTVISIGEVSFASLAILWLLYAVILAGMDLKVALKKLESNTWGKSKMTCELVSLSFMMLFSEFPNEWIELTVLVSGWAAFGFLVCSFFGKLKTAFS